MAEIEQQKLYRFNLNKAWIASMCSCGYRVVLYIFGVAQWQKNLEKTESRMIEEESPSFNVEMF